MIITGYHGTSSERAENIIRENKFELSQGDEEWLGLGIYFYVKYTDATEWAIKYKQPAVLHGIIEFADNEYFDFDSRYGKKQIAKIKDRMLELGFKPQSRIKNQCAIANFIWKNEPNLKVLIGRFAKKQSTILSLTDERERRKEFCVRDNDAIKSIVELEVITND